MRKIMIVTMLAGLSLLTACQSLSPEAIRQRDEQRCQSYGFRLGTEGMAKCLLDIDMDRRAESRAMQARMHANMMYRPVVVERRVIIDKR